MALEAQTVTPDTSWRRRDLGYVFTWLWLVGVVIILPMYGWQAWTAEPAVMLGERLGGIAFLVFLLMFGVLWILLIRFLRRRARK